MDLIYNAWGPTEWILLIFILLILFGSRKIPEVARSLGEAVREFRKAMSETEQATKQMVQQEYKERVVSERSDDPLIDLAKRKGINVEGKSRVQIVEELAKKIREEESTS
ncbi:MAG: twin-arginine translocase TatA/TatE family subunit [Thermoproteota archaeon]|jgi:sec-independent protein translocase protein TatA|nr:twin-arginine translocase TatA/TatE family subunit [Thermoproteota archaeon]